MGLWPCLGIPYHSFKKIPVKKSGYLLLLFGFFFQLSVFAQADSLRLRISVLTCAPGNELYSTFGHTALRITDSSKHTDIIYNYGTFDFEDPDFYLKFTRGKLDYFLSVQTPEQFLYEYQIEKRTVYEQVLLLDTQTKEAIAAALQDNLRGNNRYYKYDFLYNNCTSRIRDILIRYAGLTVKTPLVPAHTTFRNMLHEYLDNGGQAWSKLGIDLLLASPIDKVVTIQQSMFLPDYLMKGIDSASGREQAGILQSRNIINPGTPLNPGNRHMPLLVISAVCLVIGSISLIKHKNARVLTRMLDFLLLFITGLIGCLLLFMWFGTDHKSCAVNYNILWALPTHTIAAFSMLKKTNRPGNYFTASAVLYALVLITWIWLPQQLNPAFIPLAILLLYRSFQLRKA